MNGQEIQQIRDQIGPQVIQRAVSNVMAEISPGEVSAEDLMPLIATLEGTLVDPRTYQEAVQKLVSSGLIEQGDVPDEFDAAFVVLMVIVLRQVSEALSKQSSAPQQFARGGLTTVAKALQAQGRYGDTVLAHINPAEAAMLRRMGGSGTINPHTGLPEYFNLGKALGIDKAVKSVTNAVKGVVKALGPAAPIIAAVVAPYAIPFLAGSLGVSSLVAGALYGAGTSALTGGNVLQGAVMGGLGGGLGEAVGGAAANTIGASLSPSATSLLGNTLVGGAVGAATGQGFGRGAIGAAAGTALGNAVGNLAGQGGGTALGQGLTQAGKTIGQMTSAGIPLKQAVIGGALSGLTSGALASRSSPLDRAGRIGSDIDTQIERVNQLLEDPSVPETAKQAYSDYLKQLTAGKQSFAGMQQTLGSAAPGSPEYTTAADLMTKPGVGAASSAPAVYDQLGIAPSQSNLIGSTNLGFNIPTGLVAAQAALPFALDSLTKMQTPQDIQNYVKSNNPEYFNNLRLNSWDWNDIQQKANSAGMPLGTYVANNWNDLTGSVQYTSPQSDQPVAKARGGALSRVAYLARGSGSGRADTIDARLSDGEYVVDAETVAMLGDGSTSAGARRLDEMRNNIRKQKGRALAKGKFSPNAKSPLAYIKGAM